uniref:CARD domain-containing protein n=1 Tax=Hippocampus comes TaxID=109280 RepID=A0A3Q2Z2M9_HIPCM
MKAQNVTSDFADNVTKEVLNHLYNLREDCILNDGEVQHICQANHTRANKARDLIWTVRMKGDKASWKLIKHIQARDTYLAKHLDLNSI